jgi:mRNA interferase MazF
MISMSMMRTPRRGEIWLVDFEPSFDAEIRKVRPAVVLSLDQLARLPLRVVVPLTEWKPQYNQYSWFVRIPTSPSNGLGKESAADAFQVKSVSETRFSRLLGAASANELDAIATAVAFVVGKP